MDVGTGWTQQAGSWSIANNSAVQATGTSGYYIATVDAGKADYKLHIRMRTRYATGAAEGAVIVRFTNTSNYWMVFCDWVGGNVGIAEVNGGTRTARNYKSGWTKPHQKYVEVDVTCHGDVISATFDGGFGATYTSTFNNTATLCGIQEYRDGTYYDCVFDDFQVVDLPTYPWSRQGTVLTAGSGDDSNIYEPTVIYDTDPQILTGETYVFKAWFTGGWSSSHINYAESVDGITWTKYSGNPVIADGRRSTVLKVGSTYYLFCTPADTEVNRYTSPDGINWTLTHAGVLVRGGSGTWDSNYLSNVFVWSEGAGDWRMLYDAQASDSHQRTGYATSTDDGVTWTKSGSNPVMDWGFVIGGPTLIKVGSYYYAFMIVAPDGTSALPTYIMRWRSANLEDWEQYPYIAEIPRMGASEGEDNVVGQTADPTILIVGTTAYLFFAASSNGASSIGAQHIVLATADSRAVDRY
jgi:hypothetical protein